MLVKLFNWMFGSLKKRKELLYFVRRNYALSKLVKCGKSNFA